MQGGDRSDCFHDHASRVIVTGKGPCDSAVCVTAAGYAIKTDAGYTIKTSTTLQMTATGYWSDGTSLDLTPIATWDCTPSPVCGSDRKSTRLNSSHGYISYAVFCLKKKTISYGPVLALPVRVCRTLSPALIFRTSRLISNRPRTRACP